MMMPFLLCLYLSPPTFDPGKVSFELVYRDEVSPYSVQSAFVLPNEPLDLTLRHQGGATFKLHAPTLTVSQVKEQQWQLSAPPEPGRHEAVIHREDTGEQVRLNVFVMEPFAKVKNGMLHGYRIGTYPDKPLNNNPIYLPPRGFVKVTKDDLDVKVSPHFTLGRFLCKQKSDFPKYLVLRPRLLRKLEYLLEEVNRQGLACSSFYIMSAFRTPYYNHAIGNVRYSRHQWGGAVDFYIDEKPKDGYPDDLNGDGTIDHHDSMVLYRLIDNLSQRRDYRAFVGGLGRYRKTAAHGPFVHVDVRGFKARWGE
ncbi:hypothetical protein [Acanthopleuribacter pedis]|uniref:Peptidase M15A C-terminal domain-containing protein n=1 Tax=Acanthopleuribacter pedis TaxID=442870 RepID=A0A8J7U5L9_9BACT|nr:hypothetical protein [Acanthopleuribacter pedis]MBO1320593.1 hypothetical protein [Acanthopleuribacter pedis]